MKQLFFIRLAKFDANPNAFRITVFKGKNKHKRSHIADEVI